MIRPKINFEIIKPTMKSPIHGRDAVCGDNWDSSTEVRSPYKGVDKYVNVLPFIYNDFSISVNDLNKSLPLLIGSDFSNRLSAAIDGAQEMLDSYQSSGYMDDKNRSAIQSIIDRSRKYYDSAVSLNKFWTEYRSDYNLKKGGGSGPSYGPWPLDQEKAPGGCDNKVSPEKGIAYVPKGATGHTEVKYLCPTASDKENHNKDRTTFRDLMMASLLNCRCAQEAAATVGTYYRNKEYYDSRPGSGQTLLYAPKKSESPKYTISKNLGGKLGQDVPVIPDMPDQSPPDISEGSSSTSNKKSKKKDNTMIIVGAAAVALIAFRK